MMAEDKKTILRVPGSVRDREIEIRGQNTGYLVVYNETGDARQFRAYSTPEEALAFVESYLLCPLHGGE